jgi:hypothetical protein
MTRCLNCGADRTADQCEACGLASAAAELMLRRKLWNRIAIFVLGSLGFLVSVGWYPPLELDAILIFVGVLFFSTIWLAIWVERKAARRLEVEASKRIFFGLVPVPWLLAVLLFANGNLDRSKPVEWDARVIGKLALSMPLPNRRLIVSSWREGRRFERVSVDRDDFIRFHQGDSIVVKVEGGLAGIPWVYGVYRR